MGVLSLPIELPQALRAVGFDANDGETVARQRGRGGTHRGEGRRVFPFRRACQLARGARAPVELVDVGLLAIAIRREEHALPVRIEERLVLVAG